MAGIALFAPNDEMYNQAISVISKIENNVSIVKKVKTEDVLKNAHEAISQGINIIIARGHQATQIKTHTNAIVEEMKINAQELGLLIKKAKTLCDKQVPKIAVFSWGNMLCDTTYMNDLFDVELVRFELTNEISWLSRVAFLKNENIDVVIGGNDAGELARQQELPFVYMSATEESMEVAVKNAQMLYHMYHTREHNTAQLNSIIVSAFNGIMKVNEVGEIQLINHVMKQMTKLTDDVVGKKLRTVFKDLDYVLIEKVQRGEIENYSTLFTYNNEELVVIIEPINVDGSVKELIVSCNLVNNMHKQHSQTLEKHFLKGYTARLTFDDIDVKMKDLKKVAEKAKTYANASSPILIEAVSGPELEMITQGIHNYSTRKNAPFIAINLAGMSDEQQDKTLFGNYEDGKNISGALENAMYGTLVIKSIDKLNLQNQYKLITVIRNKYLAKNNNPEDIVLIDTRIIASSAKDLTNLRENFLFRSDLYFTLRPLRLRIPNLKYRTDDVAYLLDNYIHKYMSLYSKYHILTPGAKRVLLEYPWQGNSIQLDGFCERMILTLEQRSITEGYVRELLEELYHTDGSIYRVESEEDKHQDINRVGQEENEIDHMYDVLVKTLKKYDGNRTLTAKEMKISTTTLWRKMKKYGIEEEYLKLM